MSTFALHLVGILLLFYILPTTYAQSQDKVCVTGSLNSAVNGIYKYLPLYTSVVNVSAYYNAQQNMHLSLQLDANGSDGSYYILHNKSESVISYCDVDGNTSSLYGFNPNDCYTNWKTSVNGSYTPDTNMRLVNCNNICVTNNYYPYLDGAYIWSYYNATINSSIYYCNSSDAYLYGYILSSINSYWLLIGPGPDSIDAFSSCYLGTDLANNHRFNMDECSEWNTYDSSEWVQDTNMIVRECEMDNIIYTSTLTLSTLDVIHERIYNDQQMVVLLLCIIGFLVAIVALFVCVCLFYVRHINNKLKGLQLDNINVQYMPPELRGNTFELKEPEMSSTILIQAHGFATGKLKVTMDDMEYDENEGGDSDGADGEISISNVKKDSDDSGSDDIYAENMAESKDGVTTKILTAMGNANDNDVQTHGKPQKVLDDNDVSEENTNVLFHMIVDC